MIDIHKVITDSRILGQRYIIRDGFVFTSVTYPANVYDAIVLKFPYNVSCKSPLIPGAQRTIEEHIECISENKIDKGLVIANDIEFVLKCPMLRHLRIIPADTANNSFSFAPLYGMPAIKSLQCCAVPGDSKADRFSIDYTNFPELESLSINGGEWHKNYNRVNTLRKLGISGCIADNLTGIFSSSILDTLSVIQCKIKTLEGIQKSKKMQCLYLYHNRSLQDISALQNVKKTLRTLRIENCPKIIDFSVLSELENLELLELSGSNELLDLSFLKMMKNLKTFIFNMNVKDGDLSPCLALSYVYSEKNRRHYNLKDADLPKGQYVRGNETIEKWRRLE